MGSVTYPLVSLHKHGACNHLPYVLSILQNSSQQVKHHHIIAPTKQLWCRFILQNLCSWVETWCAHYLWYCAHNLPPLVHLPTHGERNHKPNEASYSCKTLLHVKYYHIIVQTKQLWCRFILQKVYSWVETWCAATSNDVCLHKLTSRIWLLWLLQLTNQT